MAVNCVGTASVCSVYVVTLSLYPPYCLLFAFRNTSETSLQYFHNKTIAKNALKRGSILKILT